ncbi:phosphoribosylanthranilate isomerase [Paenibacillus athensensis]|uniref:N-(5'-phosphoribosyl)anthranilate isomerase n=1 Tax=Paenibacillus athensensis TaxID=1967502 RepID=A0A4Y8Q8C2_9BACL|nr:phosphoribosylanthranilate isomerase [Paenibacillus athensensis]MCD1260231.1 phosphoribosylanthranilate isomerase [Paenibacillus athensensis]
MTAGTAVKICGLLTEAAVQTTARLPVTHVGFLFAKSKRQVTPQRAGELIALLRAEAAGRGAGEAPRAVGVFVNPTLEELEQTLAQAPLDVVQLHAGETPEFCREVRERFGVQVFKAMPVQKTQTAAPEREAVAAQLDSFRGVIDALLLDTHDPVYGGGSGQTFAWDCIPVYREWAQGAGIKLFVAGGLHANNVDQLIAEFQPDGVDVSSGVETDGVKDIAKIEAFVERVTRSGTST